MRNGIEDKTAALEAELAEIQAQLAGTERDGAEIAALAEETINGLREELTQLKNHSGVYCAGCEFTRRLWGIGMGVGLWTLWFLIWPWGASETWQNVSGILIAPIPLLLVVVRWYWLLFKRDNAWVSWNDNDAYRRISARWNGSLERARMR